MSVLLADITGTTPPNAIEREIEDEIMKPFSTFDTRISHGVEAAIIHGLALRSVDRTQTMDQLLDELSEDLPEAVNGPPPERFLRKLFGGFRRGDQKNAEE